MPNGSSHPFAARMLAHFKEQHNDLRCIHRYPLLIDQEQRYITRGWTSVNARSLWDLWCDDNFVPVSERVALNSVEPFDEWEEFALFTSHYFLLLASSTWGNSVDKGLPKISRSGYAKQNTRVTVHQGAEQQVPSRIHGALLQSSSHSFEHHGGYSGTKRLETTDIYCTGNAPDSPEFLKIPARQCHTITKLNGKFDCLLVGGRNAPTQGLSDCWLRRNGKWTSVDPLPIPLYRHSAVLVKNPANKTEGVLIFGGRSTGGNVMGTWILWTESTGWKVLACDEDHRVTPRFSAAMISLGQLQSGILLGGMCEDGTVISNFHRWSVNFESNTIAIESSFRQDPVNWSICRVGACLNYSPLGLLLIGGIEFRGIPPSGQEIVKLTPIASTSSYSAEAILRDGEPACNPQPLLVGHTAIWDGEGLVMIGGGATCFSFNTHLNRHIWKMNRQGNVEFASWRLCHYSQEPNEPLSKRLKALTINRTPDKLPIMVEEFKHVRRGKLSNTKNLLNCIRENEPFVFEGVNLGDCTDKWTTEYLKSKVGPDRSVLIHDSESEHMTFENRNFERKEVKFANFIDAIISGQKQYLRSLSANRKATAAFDTDYPEISCDFTLPPELNVDAMFHSSVLRIAGPVRMWLHYDVMANILCQIRGTKKLLLFPPSDITNLGIDHGKSSSDLDAFDIKSFEVTSLANCSPLEVTLRPGDVLFLPPLWGHTAAPLEGISIAINIFFRNLPDYCYEVGKDLNGNRDLYGYADGRKDVAKIKKRFESFPPEVSRFYLQRLAMELLEEAGKAGE